MPNHALVEPLVIKSKSISSNYKNYNNMLNKFVLVLKTNKKS